MENEKLNTMDAIDVSLVRGAGSHEAVDMHGVFNVTCKDANGNIKWEDKFNNTVTTVGKNALLDAYFGAAAVGVGTTTMYMGLITSNGYSAISSADTMSSHAGWLEGGGGSAPGYNQTTRRAITFASAASGSKATSNGVIFSMNASGTVKGAFVANNSTKGGTTGILYSAGLFTVGDKVVTNGDTLSVTYTASA